MWGHLVDESENGTVDGKIKGQMGKLRQSIVTTVEWCNCNYWRNIDPVLVCVIISFSGNELSKGDHRYDFKLKIPEG